MKRIIQITLFFIVLQLFMSCNKKNTSYEVTPIQLSIVEVNNGCKLAWNKVISSDFERYEIFRSTKPIDDPASLIPIDPALKIATITDLNINTFNDSIGAGQLFFRVQVVLKFRKLLSNNVQYKNGFVMSQQYSSSLISKPLKNIFVRNIQSKYTSYNYEQDSLLVPSFSLTTGSIIVSTNNENQVPSLYAYTGSNLLEYNAQTFALTRSHQLPFSGTNAGIVNGTIYFGYGASDSLVTYDLASDTRIDGFYCDNCYKALPSSNGNKLLVTSTSSLGYANLFNIGPDKKLQLISHVLDNTHFLYSFARISPNGNFIISLNGDVLDQSLVKIGSLENPNFNTFGDFIFSDDEKFIVAQTLNGVEIYDINTFKRIKFYESSSLSFNLSDIYLDDQTIIKIDGRFNSATAQSNVLVRKFSLTP